MDKIPKIGKTRPYPFQYRNLLRIENAYHGRAIIGDDMGLGKTPQAYWFLKRNVTGPTVVICPAIAKEHWKRQGREHIGRAVQVLYGRKPYTGTLKRGNSIYVINYDILGEVTKGSRTWGNVLRRLKPQLVVIDEGHLIKEWTSQRTQAVMTIAHKAKYVLALSGTPIVNRPIEFYYTLVLLRPDMFESRWTFGLRYCALHMGPRGYDYNGASNTEELHAVLTHPVTGCMVRNRKIDVIEDLPKKTRTTIPVRLPKKGMLEYERAQSDFIRWLAEQNRQKASRALGAEGICRLGYLKRLAAEHKVKLIVDWIDEFLEESDEKLLIFGIHRKVLEPLYAKYRDQAVLVDGRITGNRRQLALDRFNKHKKTRLFFGNLIAGGVVWSCTSANTVLFAEMDWVPGNHIQAEDRVSGIKRGTGQPVNVYYMVAVNTLEERLCEVLQKKSRILASVLDGKPVGDLQVYDQVIKSIIARGKRFRRKATK